MKKKLQILWWTLTGAKRFRVHLRYDSGEWIGLTDSMSYLDAYCTALLSDGKIVCDHN